MLLPFHVGDIVALRHQFCPCGRVLAVQGETCAVTFGSTVETLPAAELMLISFRNVPNLRLVTLKIEQAAEILPGSSNAFSYKVIAFAGGGTIAARAFADYVLKMPLEILTPALQHLSQGAGSVSEAIAQSLNLEFAFLASS